MPAFKVGNSDNGTDALFPRHMCNGVITAVVPQEHGWAAHALENC